MRITDTLAGIIGRLENWQNSPAYYCKIADIVGHHDINRVKSELLRILNKLENAK
mgnify:CR=1 FL=1